TLTLAGASATVRGVAVAVTTTSGNCCGAASSAQPRAAGEAKATASAARETERVKSDMTMNPRKRNM
ncbi:hypothetical protein K4A07_18335, partial [Lactiplantibacillus plantarum]|nr:hypothetical protein [Lactiplantibacillus plantarum]